MNNPLAQKAQYYLNESYRLSEELKNEETYSELLENVLFKLLGEEQFTQLIEYVMQGDVLTGKDGKKLSPEQSARRANRLRQIIDIGVKAAEAGDSDLVRRAAHSALGKGAGRHSGVDTSGHVGTHLGAVETAFGKKARGETDPESKIQFGQKEAPKKGDPLYGNSRAEDPTHVVDRTWHDSEQIMLSKRARNARARQKATDANTF